MIIVKKPKIRFKGFTETWEQRKLGEVFNERTERAKGNEELLSVTINNGVIRQIDSDKRNIASEDKSNYKIVQIGDVPYNSMRMWQGAVGNSEYNGIVSPAYTVLVPSTNADSKFFVELFKKNSTLNIFQRWSQGLTSDTWNLKYPILSKIEFYMPMIDEQKKIGSLFSKLDHLITLHQRKCENLKKLKKFMLQKLFPQNGENVPKVRFSNFTDTWEQRKLKECVLFLDRLRKPLEGAKRVSGPYPYYGASGIVDYVNEYLFDEELVLLSEDGANILDRNYPVCFLAEGKYWVNNHAHVLKTRTKNDNNFICNSLERKSFVKYNTGMAMPKLNKDICENILLYCPKYHEQKKIGDILRFVDNLITLHQSKCDKLKEVKKYMLQNMFI